MLVRVIDAMGKHSEMVAYTWIRMYISAYLHIYIYTLREGYRFAMLVRVIDAMKLKPLEVVSYTLVDAYGKDTYTHTSIHTYMHAYGKDTYMHHACIW
jgi:hypothetical protein